MFTGSMVALVTPMHVDGSVDYPALERLVEFYELANQTSEANTYREMLEQTPKN